MTIIKSLTCVCVLMSLTAGAALAESNIMFILDGSNSMWGQVDGVAKIETAKKVLSRMLLDLPADTKIGLMAYGHTKKEDCADVQVLAPIGSTDAKGLVSMLQGVVPKGKTPITFALEKSFHQFPKLEQNNTVVLVSDGLETCGGDPCKVAGELAKKGLNVKKVHVVGFDVNKDERKQLECIATATGGKYFEANSTEGFKTAIAEVKKEVQAVQVPPEPKPTGPKEVFRDDFNGEELGEHWEVLKPNPDSFIVEDGKLLIVSGTPGSMADETVENVFKLSEPLPKDDWIITAKFSAEFQTAAERAYIGIFDNGDNYLEISLQATVGKYGLNRYAAVDLAGVKRSKGKDKTAVRRLWANSTRYSFDEDKFADGAKNLPQPILLRLEKKGRSYVGSAMLEGAEEPTWLTLDKFTILRQKGEVAVGLYQTNKVTGEGTILVDWIKIESIEN